MVTSQQLHDDFDRVAKLALQVKKERDLFREALVATTNALRSYQRSVGDACPTSLTKLADHTDELLSRII